MLKSELRKIYQQKRNNLSYHEVDILSEKIFENFILQFKPTENQNIHCFISIPKLKEVNTKKYIDYCFEHNIRVFVPKMVQNKLINIKINANTIFKTNSWGIEEPIGEQDSEVKNFDYVITPLLYCDFQGNRVGYGKGFYDGLFSSIPATKKVGISFFPPNESIEDIREEDIPLDYLVCPDEILSFST